MIIDREGPHEGQREESSHRTGQARARPAAPETVT